MPVFLGAAGEVRGGTREPGNLENCSILYFFCKTCLSKQVPIHTVKYIPSISPWHPKRETSPKSQTSSIFGPHGSNMSKRSFCISEKSGLQRKSSKSPVEFPEDQTLRIHTMLWAMISTAREACISLRVPSGAVNCIASPHQWWHGQGCSWMSYLPAGRPATRSVRLALQKKDLAANLPVLQSVTLKNHKAEAPLARGEACSAGNPRPRMQDRRQGRSLQLPVLRMQELGQKRQCLSPEGIRKIFLFSFTYGLSFCSLLSTTAKPFLVHFSLLTNPPLLSLTPGKLHIYIFLSSSVSLKSQCLIHRLFSSSHSLALGCLCLGPR